MFKFKCQTSKNAAKVIKNKDIYKFMSLKFAQSEKNTYFCRIFVLLTIYDAK